MTGWRKAKLQPVPLIGRALYKAKVALVMARMAGITDPDAQDANDEALDAVQAALDFTTQDEHWSQWTDFR